MPEMRTQRTVAAHLQGVIVADSVHMQQVTTLTGDTVILARRIDFPGASAVIKGSYNIYIFPISTIAFALPPGANTTKPFLMIEVSGRQRPKIPVSAPEPDELGVCYLESEITASMPWPGSHLFDPGSNGRDGASGADGPDGNSGSCGTSANGDSGSAGGNGEDGARGADGADGEAGTNGNYVWASHNCQWGDMYIDVSGRDGGRGQDGGNGGRGGNGGNGGKGGDGADCSCSDGGAGNGGTGGRGGDAGKPGSGANGGNGGWAGDGGYVYVEIYDHCGECGVYANLQGGLGGDPGNGGQPGELGVPGSGGDGGAPGSNSNCSETSGHSGAAGAAGGGQSTATSGWAGSRGPDGNNGSQEIFESCETIPAPVVNAERPTPDNSVVCLPSRTAWSFEGRLHRTTPDTTRKR
jgi:hypothetical protein